MGLFILKPIDPGSSTTELYRDRIKYIIDQIFIAYNIEKVWVAEFDFNYSLLQYNDFEFNILLDNVKANEEIYISLCKSAGLFLPPYIKFCANAIISKDLKNYYFFGKSRIRSNHLSADYIYKFPTMWLFEDFEDELTTGLILSKL